MAEFIKNVRFVGGAKDGQEIPIRVSDRHYLPPCLYYALPLSLEQAEKLKVDENISYRWPDEVYRLDENRQYVFSHIVHYDPREEIYAVQG